MTYLVWNPRAKLLRAALIPLLLISVLAASVGLFNTVDPDGNIHKLERHEHHITHPYRMQASLFKSMPTARNLLHEATPESVPLMANLILTVSLMPIIYIILKRLLLYPLKYTSHFVANK